MIQTLKTKKYHSESNKSSNGHSLIDNVFTYNSVVRKNFVCDKALLSDYFSTSTFFNFNLYAKKLLIKFFCDKWTYNKQKFQKTLKSPDWKKFSSKFPAGNFNGKI